MFSVHVSQLLLQCHHDLLSAASSLIEFRTTLTLTSTSPPAAPPTCAAPPPSQVDSFFLVQSVMCAAAALTRQSSSMDRWEETREGAPPSKSTLCGKDDNQSKAQRPFPHPTVTGAFNDSGLTVESKHSQKKTILRLYSSQ
ncbi:hypothetical protein FQA47_013111 [Oryzias melastigma]|uniref:Uncharacterized protein n=1 Tax=Oryzias melastigma TaxID=30732 RepID=A0A834C792_ORYME|nr:hypothetical protein FQA47_013111 [Oryzias melastigma]